MWRKLDDGAVLPDECVLLWFKGAKRAVFGMRYVVNLTEVRASSDMARGVEFTHYMPSPGAPTDA